MTDSSDAVDDIVKQWQRQRPELETHAMAVIGRLKRCSALVQPKLDTVFNDFGLSFWEFDVLATLRRSGEPYCMTPTALFSTMMITSGTMTHRLKQLESRGFVERLDNQDDARSKLVKLTDSGFQLIDQAVAVHVDNETAILSTLNKDDITDINM